MTRFRTICCTGLRSRQLLHLPQEPRMYPNLADIDSKKQSETHYHQNLVFYKQNKNKIKFQPSPAYSNSHKFTTVTLEHKKSKDRQLSQRVNTSLFTAHYPIENSGRQIVDYCDQRRRVWSTFIVASPEIHWWVSKFMSSSDKFAGFKSANMKCFCCLPKSL